jgi:flagellar hook-length control protein FliK
MLGPTATTVVKNAAPADAASNGKANATTGFSNLLAQEMSTPQNAAPSAAGAPGAEMNSAGEASAAAAVEPASPAASPIGDGDKRAWENSISMNNGAAAPEGKIMPGLPNPSALTHQNSVRLPPVVPETSVKGSVKAEIEDQAGEREPVSTKDRAAHNRTREYSSAGEGVSDQPVLPDSAPQTAIAARPPQQQHVDLPPVQPEPTRKLEQGPAGRTLSAGAVSLANGANKDPVRVGGDGNLAYRGTSVGAPGAPVTPAAPRQSGVMRSSSAGDQPFALDSGMRAANFGRIEPALQTPALQTPNQALEAEPFPKPLPDLSSPLQNPLTAPVEALLAAAESQPVSAAGGTGFSGDTASVEPRLGVAGWDNALGQKVLWMVSQQQQVAELNLNPPDLGPLQVVLSIDNGEASATFVSQHADVRQALEAALPRLREMMAESGITLSSATVSQDGARQQGGFEQHERPGGARAAGAHVTSDGATGTGVGGMPIEPGRSRLVDTFA